MNQYRNDIDGLRAVAVLSVVFYHAFPTLLPGGFIGVDVFFVISGFLITSIIIRDIDKGSFSLVQFLERRARRILPASAVTAAVCLLAGCVILLPSDLAELGHSAIYQSFFAANFFFWKESDYFATASELKPLLHMWSLAVEEQFYFLFPTYLLITTKLSRKHIFKWLAVPFAISLALCLYAAIHHPTANFFLLPTRGWELLAGSILAVKKPPASHNLKLHNLLGHAGLVLILWTSISYSTDTRFPGIAAIPVILGTWLVIFTGQYDTRLARMLAFPPIAFVGLISYSLYLWHWPILVFPRYLLGANFTTAVRISCIVFSFIAAFLSWKYIETPFRKKYIAATRPAILKMAAFSSLTIAGFSAIVFHTEGIPNRYSSETLTLIDRQQRSRLHEATPIEIESENVPKIGNKESIPQFLLWGDSHATVIASALNNLGETHGWSAYNVSRAGREGRILSSHLPTQKRNQAIKQFIERHQIQEVLLAGRWSSYFGELEEEGCSDERRRELMQQLPDLIQELQGMGANVSIMLEVPCQPYGDAYKNQILLSQIIPNWCTADRTSRNEHDSHIRTSRSIINGCKVRLLDPSQWCFDSDGMSITEIDGTPTYFDDDHLSTFGADSLLAAMLQDWVQSLESRSSP